VHGDGPEVRAVDAVQIPDDAAETVDLRPTSRRDVQYTMPNAGSAEVCSVHFKY